MRKKTGRAVGNGILGMSMGRKPTKKTALKFNVRDGPRHGMTCMRNQPELNVSPCGGSCPLAVTV